MSVSDPGAEYLPLIDIEASGLGPESYPIEIGISLGAHHLESWLINPEWVDEWIDSGGWDELSETVHGLTPETLSEQGEDPLRVVSALNRRLAGMTLYSDGAEYDREWVRRLFAATLLRPAFEIRSVYAWAAERHGRSAVATLKASLEGAERPHRARGDLIVIRRGVMGLEPPAASPSPL